MDDNIKHIFHKIGFKIEELSDLDNLIIPREKLLDDDKYYEIQTIIPPKNYSVLKQ